MAEVVEVPVVDLQLDPSNARLGQTQPSQQAIYLALAEQQSRRIIKLAEDIVENGLDPITLPAVVPTEGRRKWYRVIEGNRRILALKALDTPSIILPSLAPSDQKRLTELSQRYVENPIGTVRCVLFESEEEAFHWIQLRHTGANDGIGLVEWDSNEQDRYKARHGGQPVRTPAGQILDFVARVEGSDGSLNRGILTNVKRLISTRGVREALGIEIDQGQVVTRYAAAEVAKGLAKVVDDFRSRRVKVKDIYYEADRMEYIGKFPPEDLPTATKVGPKAVSLSDLKVSGSNGKPAKKTTKKPAPTPSPLPRSTLVPSDFRANVTHPRINAIFNELASLNIEQYPNSCAVLLRVFIELSVDHEIERLTLMTDSQRRSQPLAKRLKTVAGEMQKQGTIGDQLFKAMEKVADGRHVVAASSATFNQYVHNQYVYPKPPELRTSWDELQPFVEKLWP